MSSAHALLPELVIPDDGESSFIPTPVLSQILASFGNSEPSTATPNASSAAPSLDRAESSASNSPTDHSNSSASLLSPNSGIRRLPIPTPTQNRSQASITFVDTEDDGESQLGALPPEVATADISIAPDGSFVETSSGQAARELKKRYDRMMDVSVDKRSPFAITAFTNQHGRQMYRVGHRALNPPGRTAEEVEEEVERRATLQFDNGTQRSAHAHHGDPRRATHSVTDRRSPRRSRLSVNAFIPPTFLPPAPPRSPDHPPEPVPPLPCPLSSTSTSTSKDKDGARSPPSRKLRKTRSNPQIPIQDGVTGPSPVPHTGRGHSQSVTAADLPRFSSGLAAAAMPAMPAPPPSATAPPLDLFSEVMHWTPRAPGSPLSTSSSAASYSSRSRSTSAASVSRGASVDNPFGARVQFDAPGRPHPTHLGVDAPQLREMQSFESGLTARAEPAPRRATVLSQAPVGSLSSDEQQQPDEPPSAPSTPSLASAPFTPRPGSVDRGYTPTMETLMYTQYSTEVFDVLQTYRGLPLLEKLLPDSTETTVIKMSLTADERATPRDDPRFVVWGEVLPDDSANASRARAGTGTSADRSSSRSRRRSTKGSDDRPGRADAEAEAAVPEKILLAATIERWIAQLTSELNYDELLVFFMTYRTYIRPVDLCHLLICRLHWALGAHTNDHDEMVRRIVRVRTFVAMRYWLLTFFEVDFIPNRELRLLIAGWLNALKKDPILQKHHDAPGIVRKLVSVVRECKEVHSQRVRPAGRAAPTSNSSSNGPVSSSPDVSPPERKHPLVALFGKSFEGVAAKGWTVNDSDLDLDFVPEGQHGDGDGAPGNIDGAQSAGDSTSVLQQPLHRAIMEHRPSISASPAPLPLSPATLPMHQNMLSRAFVNTIGRLGRWKRVNSRPAALNSRHAGAPPIAVLGDVSAFDLELNVTDDLLTVRGGVEQYLKVLEMDQQTQPRMQSSIPGVIAPPPPPPPPAEPIPPDSPPPEPDSEPEQNADVVQEAEVAMPASPRSAGSAPVHIALASGIGIGVRAASPSSTRSSDSSSSYGQVIRSRYPHSSTSSRANPWGVDVISLDDLELSDDEEPPARDGGDEVAGPPGLTRTPRRLPLRRDFEFIDRTRGSVSSIGLASAARDSVSSAASSGGQPSGTGLGTTLQQWQLDALVDSLSDEDETGDVEDALRRLEGHLNPQRQREKSSKVDNWVKTIRERLEAGDYGTAPDAPHNSTEGSGMDGDDHRASLAWSVHTETAVDTGTGSGSGPSSPRSARRIAPSYTTDTGESSTPVIPQTPYNIPLPPDPPGVDPAVPEEILRSRLTTSPLSPQSSLRSAATSTAASALFAAVPPPHPQAHHSWVLQHRSGELAEHFGVIDRELFLEVRFEELIGDDWVRTVDEPNVLDWGAFLKERARWKAERRGGYKTSGLATVRARFNLMACFVQSEIVLTPPSSRHVLVGKFIRIAWKCYSLNNYATLVAIITGLRSDWVSRAMRKLWNRVNVYNLRMLNDLTSFVSRENDFCHVRSAVRALEEWKSGPCDETGSSMGSMRGGKDATPPAGVPFVGIYLSQLYRYSQLPDLIDPTAPTEAVGIDRSTNSFHTPAHPEVFATLAPLPPSMQLEPLINVHKQRLIAGTIKSLVAGQHLASRVAHPVDRKLFQRCLKLRALDPDTLQRVQAMYAGPGS